MLYIYRSYIYVIMHKFQSIICSCEISTRNISWRVKAASALDWQSYHLHVLTVIKSGNLSLLELSGPVQACTATAYIKSHCIISLMSQITLTAMLLLLIVKKIRLGVANNSEYLFHTSWKSAQLITSQDYFSLREGSRLKGTQTYIINWQ